MRRSFCGVARASPTAAAGSNSSAELRPQQSEFIFLGTSTSEGIPRVSCLTDPTKTCPVCHCPPFPSPSSHATGLRQRRRRDPASHAMGLRRRGQDVGAGASRRAEGASSCRSRRGSTTQHRSCSSMPQIRPPPPAAAYFRSRKRSRVRDDGGDLFAAER
ncbi:hypothetical protein ACP70R_042098 [Stipagrostis hirtigluma subsp. patula]